MEKPGLDAFRDHAFQPGAQADEVRTHLPPTSGGSTGISVPSKGRLGSELGFHG